MKKLIQAFTLIEVMIVIAIMGIVAVFSAPLLTSLNVNTGLTTTNNDLVAAFQYARSSSIRHQNRVVVCSSKDAGSENPSCDDSGAWSEGWIVFIDADNSTEYISGGVDRLLAVHEKTAINGVSIEVVKATNLTNYVSFAPPAGQPFDDAGGNQSGIFKICIENQTDHIRAVQLNISGRIASTRDKAVIGSSCP